MFAKKPSLQVHVRFTTFSRKHAFFALQTSAARNRVSFDIPASEQSAPMIRFFAFCLYILPVLHEMRFSEIVSEWQH